MFTNNNKESSFSVSHILRWILIAALAIGMFLYLNGNFRFLPSNLKSSIIDGSEENSLDTSSGAELAIPEGTSDPGESQFIFPDGYQIEM